VAAQGAEVPLPQAHVSPQLEHSLRLTYRVLQKAPEPKREGGGDRAERPVGEGQDGRREDGRERGEAGPGGSWLA